MEFIHCDILRCAVLLLSWEKFFIRRKALLTPNKFTQSANTSQGPYLDGTKYKAWSFEVVMMHLELCESILRLQNFWYYNLYKFA